MNMTKNALFALMILGALGAAGAQPEQPRTSFMHGTRLFGGVHFELWNYAGSRTTEAVLPLYYSMALDNLVKGMALDVVTSPMMGMYDAGSLASPDAIFSVAGTKFRISQNINDIVLATFGMQIPTTRNSLSARQKSVLGALASPQMNFRVSRIQTGLDIDATVATSLALTDGFILGAGGGFLLHGPYVPIESENRYNPGNEFTVTLGTELKGTGRSVDLSWLSDIAVTLYTPDRIDTAGTYRAVFRSGTRLSINSHLSAVTVRGAKNVLSASLHLTGDERRMADDSLIHRDEEIDAFVLSDCFRFAAGGKLRPFLIGKGSFFTPVADAGRTALAGLGGGADVALTRRLSVRAQGVFEAGSMDKSILLGGEINGGLHYVF